MPGFLVFSLRIAPRRDAAADRSLPPTAGGRDGSYQDTGVKRTIKADVRQRAAVGSTGVRFEFGDDFHGADFRRAGDRAAWKRRLERIERVAFVAERPLDARHQVLHILVAFKSAELRHADRVGPADLG